ncbi:MAG: lipoyl(octanoyl) transferase LipB [Chitinophagales bacterium]|nr:lipoyl(octanoyl) transferase LipB [Chitinophagales bacterium]
MSRRVRLMHLGVMPYETAWQLQEDLFVQKTTLKLQQKATVLPDGFGHHLLICAHPPVYTLGKNGKEEHLLAKPEELLSKGVQYFKNNRGGDITFHGPGQIVVYPIFDIEDWKRDIHWYMRSLEEVVIRTLADFGIKGERIEKVTGVWIAPESPQARKICAFGVRTSRWVSMHGLALNVNTDLSYFKWIVPCGIADKGVTSMQEELGYSLDINKVEEALKFYFEQVFEMQLC